MASEIAHELLGRELPAVPYSVDGVPFPQPEVNDYARASAELINDLRACIAQMEQKRDTGTDAFNRMVRLANQAAANIVANATAEADRITAQAHGIGPSDAGEAPSDDESAAEAGGFGADWKDTASIDERAAAKTFFDQIYEDPSRDWILADAG